MGVTIHLLLSVCKLAIDVAAAPLLNRMLDGARSAAVTSESDSARVGLSVSPEPAFVRRPTLTCRQRTAAVATTTASVSRRDTAMECKTEHNSSTFNASFVLWMCRQPWSTAHCHWHDQQRQHWRAT